MKLSAIIIYIIHLCENQITHNYKKEYNDFMNKFNNIEKWSTYYLRRRYLYLLKYKNKEGKDNKDNKDDKDNKDNKDNKDDKEGKDDKDDN